jgi:hypothetical protein
MRLLLLAFCAAAVPAYAQLYRWVDPQTGSVKYSNHPPPWHGDPARQSAPKVEVIPPQFKDPPRPSAALEKPAAAAAAPSNDQKAGLVADLESRWRKLLEGFTAFPQQADFERAGAGLQQQAQAYEAVRAELDRIDPAGAARRRNEESGVAEQVKKGLESWLRK